MHPQSALPSPHRSACILIGLLNGEGNGLVRLTVVLSYAERCDRGGERP
jgi:hypothetical protein